MSRRRFSAMRTAGRLARPAHNDDAHMQVRNRGHVAKLPEPGAVNIPYLSACLATSSVLT